MKLRIIVGLLMLASVEDRGEARPVGPAGGARFVFYSPMR
jgi:hypothetical protein